MGGNLAQAGTGAVGGGRDFSPASATLTGDTYEDKPVFIEHFSGASLANGTVLQTGVDRIKDAGGETNDATNDSPFPYEDGTNTAQVLVSAAGALTTNATGVFLLDPFSFWVEYTLL